MEMTQEVREQLTGITPSNASDIYTFTPTFFEGVPEDFKPTFSVTKLSNGEVAKIKAQLVDESNRVYKTKTAAVKNIKADAEYMMQIVKKHTVGWSKLYSTFTGNEIPFNTDISVIETFPEVLISSIFGEICKITGFIPRG